MNFCVPVSDYIYIFVAYILNSIINRPVIMSKKFTLSEVFNQLGLIHDLSVDDKDENSSNDAEELVCGRTSFHLSTLEATYIKTSKPNLCKQKEFVYSLKITH